MTFSYKPTTIGGSDRSKQEQEEYNNGEREDPTSLSRTREPHQLMKEDAEDPDIHLKSSP